MLFALCIGTVLSSSDCDVFEALPTDLNEAFLRFDQQVHVSGTFFIDYKSSRTHNITFDLKSTSHVRFYVAPHAIDIDIFLYRLNESISFKVYHSAISFIIHKSN